MRPSNYETTNKRIIIDTIKKLNKKFTIKEIYNIINASEEKVGMTTIYREIDYLIKNEQIIKMNTNDNTTVYQYIDVCDNGNCILLNCIKCNQMHHIDCNMFNKLNKHIKSEHDFEISNKNFIINGLCNKCKEKTNEKNI